MRPSRDERPRRSAARPALAFSLFAVLALAGCPTKTITRARPASPPAVVLVSAYEPFGGLKTNTSWEVARRLDGETVAGLEVVTVMLPVVWEEARRKLGEAAALHEPRAALSMGVGWSGWIEVESTARNRRGPHRDNRRELPPSREVEPGGPAELATRLPAKRIVERLKRMGLPVRGSDTAGDYLCNEAFYALLRATGPEVPAGLIHLPRAGPDRAKKATRAELESTPVTVDDLVRGIRAAIEETAAARAVRSQGGTQ